MSHPFRVRTSSSTLALVLALSAPAAAAPDEGTAEFRVLDAIEGNFVNLASFPVRPMVLSPDGVHLWALNHHDNEVQKFVAHNGGSLPTEPLAPLATYPAPWDPVAIAYWQGTDKLDDADDEVLIVGRGNWGVMGLSAQTGEVTRFLQLRPDNTLPEGVDARIGRMAEPGDILVSEFTDMAFVSCSGADSVIQIDLSGPAPGTIVRVFHESVALDDFRCKYPLFLSWDPQPMPGEEQALFVTPLISGNNSMWEARGGLTGGQKVLDLASDQVTHPLNGVRGLPDEDCFRIVPFTADAPGERGSVEPVARGMGTLLFQHGTNPANNRFWQLNTEANNKDPELQSEPDVNGIFSFNRITRLLLNGSPSEPGPSNFITLDPPEMTGLASPFDETTTLGQPFALDFSPDGLTFVTGLLTDNVALFTPTGVLIVERDLAPLAGAPAGQRTIPRGVLWKAKTTNRIGDFLVYCWGDNTVRQFHYELGGSLTVDQEVVYDLGHDPTPATVAAGRNLFFDGTNSAFGNLSCASCHVEGGADFLAWNLSNNPRGVTDPDNVFLDSKGGMVTQTLVGLERVPPFHWRGERELTDFNGAFEGLLGGDRLTDAQFANFQDYIFSLRNPGSPNENRDRLVDSSISFVHDLQSPPADACEGQDTFMDTVVFRNRNTCNGCHSVPVGTLNEINDEIPGTIRTRLAHRKVAPFHEIWRKQQSPFLVDLIDPDEQGVEGPPIEVPYLGSGINHLGNRLDLHDFITEITAEPVPPISPTRGENITAFVHQLDQGLAPAVHYGFYLDAATHAVAQTELAYLTAQATTTISNVESQCDIVVHGQRWDGSALVPTSWFFDRHLGGGRFKADDPAVANRTLSDFLDGALNDGERNVFLGTASGSGESMSIDADLDGLRDAVDFAPHTPIHDLGDNTPPQFLRTPSVLWKTARCARVRFEVDEASSAVVRYRRAVPGTEWQEVQSHKGLFTKVHSFLLPDLKPSTSFPSANPAGYADAGFPTVTSIYDLQILVTDRKSQTTTFDMNGAVTAAPFIDPQDPNLDPAADLTPRHLHMEHVLSKLAMDPLQVSDGFVHVSVHPTVAYKRGGDFVADDYTLAPASNRIVVGRALRKFPSTAVINGTVQDVERYENLIPVTDPAVTLLTGQVDLDVNGPGNNNPTMGIGGSQAGLEFLVTANLSDGSGQTDIEFSLPVSALNAGDSVVFVVDAVIEVPDPAQWALVDTTATPLLIPTQLPAPWGGNGSLGLSRWSFPSTTEANALAEAVYQP